MDAPSTDEEKEVVGKEPNAKLSKPNTLRVSSSEEESKEEVESDEEEEEEEEKDELMGSSGVLSKAKGKGCAK